MAGHPYGTVQQNQVAQHRHRHHDRIRACIDGSHGPHVQSHRRHIARLLRNRRPCRRASMRSLSRHRSTAPARDAERRHPYPRSQQGHLNGQRDFYRVARCRYSRRTHADRRERLALPRRLFAVCPAHRTPHHLRAEYGVHRASSVVGQAARLVGTALVLGLSGALSPTASYEPRNPHYPHRLVGAGITACTDPCGSRGFLSPRRTPLVPQAGPTGQHGKKARPRTRHGAPRAWRRMRRRTCLRAA